MLWWWQEIVVFVLGGGGELVEGFEAVEVVV